MIGAMITFPSLSTGDAAGEHPQVRRVCALVDALAELHVGIEMRGIVAADEQAAAKDLVLMMGVEDVAVLLDTLIPALGEEGVLDGLVVQYESDDGYPVPVHPV